MVKRLHLVLGTVLLLMAATTNAQSTTELDPVTVTSTLQSISASATGRNIVVLKGEQFSKLPVHSIDELLRYIPGIEVQMRGPLGAQSDIVLRGGTFQQVLVIMDGVRLNDANTGHFNSYIPISPTQIERIEVLKGAASAIYGTEAVGGVINIITKAFAVKESAGNTGEQGEPKPSIAHGFNRGIGFNRGSGQIAVGSYGTITANAGAFFQTKNTAIDAGFLTNHTTGQLQRGIDGFVHATTASIGISHSFSPYLKLSVRTAFDTRHFAAQNFYTTFLSDTATEKVTTFWNQAQLQYAKKKHSFTLNAGYKTLKDEYRYNAISIANTNRSKLLQSLAVYSFKPTAGTTITAGAQWLNKQITSNDRGNHQLNQLGAFALLYQQVGKHFFINPALRLEWNQRSGSELVPQLNVSYKFPQVQLRASGGKTIRDADFTERYNNYNKIFVTGGSIGNPDLLSERSWSYEAGADFFSVPHTRISVTGFQSRFSRLIDYVATPYSQILHNQNLSPTGNFALAKNIGGVVNTGAELDMQYNQQWSNQQLWLSAGLTLISTRSNQPVTSFYLSSHANVLAIASAVYSYRWVQLSINGVYKSRNERAASAINAAISKEYFVMNSRLAASVYKSKMQVFVQADNLFNKSYSDLLGAMMPGRWVQGGVAVHVW